MDHSQGHLLSRAALLPEQMAGVDEAGRGCLAGPVVAGACILPASYDLPGLDDSKRLKPKDRERLYPLIRAQATAWAVGLAWPGEIDRINILQATFQAMSRAVAGLKTRPLFLLVDGNKTVPKHVLTFSLAQEAVVGGDGLIPAISAASVLAKTFRDRLMTSLDKRYPGYGFAQHFGYGTQVHTDAIRQLGPCAMHRMTFAKVKPEPAPIRQGSLF